MTRQSPTVSPYSSNPKSNARTRTTFITPIRNVELRQLADKAGLEGDRETYEILHELLDGVAEVEGLNEKIEDALPGETIANVVEALCDAVVDLDVATVGEVTQVIEDYDTAAKVLRDASVPLEPLPAVRDYVRMREKARSLEGKLDDANAELAQTTEDLGCAISKACAFAFALGMGFAP